MLEEPDNLNNDNQDNSLDAEPTEEVTPPEETSNRTFIIVAAIIGLLILLTLGAFAAYVFYLGPRLSVPRSATQTARQFENLQAIQQETSTAEAALWTPTPEPSLTPTNTTVPTLANATNTPVVAISGATTTATVLADSATLVFLQTQLSVQLTGTAAASKITPTGALATTGFFDQVGLPGLIVLTLALLGVIFLARRLRTVPVSHK